MIVDLGSAKLLPGCTFAFLFNKKYCSLVVWIDESHHQVLGGVANVWGHVSFSTQQVLQEGEEESTAQNHEGVEVVSRAEEEEEGISSPAVSSSSVPRVDEVNGEDGDVLSELPPSPAVKLRRPRSETESRGPRVSLIPFKGRKRSHTLYEVEGQHHKDEEVGGVRVWSWRDVTKCEHPS